MLSILIVHRFELFPLIWSSSASQISPQSLSSQLNFSERMPSTRIRKFWTNTSLAPVSVICFKEVLLFLTTMEIC